VGQAAAQAVAGLSWESTVAQTLEVLQEAGSQDAHRAPSGFWFPS